MANEIRNMLFSIPKLKDDFKIDFRDNQGGSKLDWKFDWDAASGGAPANLAPSNQVAPVITGTGAVGQVLRVSNNGSWTGYPAPTFTYQWQGNGVNIAGATSATYTLAAGQAGQSVRCVVTANNGVGGNVNANSNAIAVA